MFLESHQWVLESTVNLFAAKTQLFQQSVFRAISYFMNIMHCYLKADTPTTPECQNISFNSSQCRFNNGSVIINYEFRRAIYFLHKGWLKPKIYYTLRYNHFPCVPLTWTYKCWLHTGHIAGPYHMSSVFKILQMSTLIHSHKLCQGHVPATDWVSW